MLYVSEIFAFKRFATYKRYTRNGTKYYKYKMFSLLCGVTSIQIAMRGKNPRTEQHFPHSNYLKILK